MISGLALCAFAFAFVDVDHLQRGASINTPSSETAIWPLVIVLAMIVYVAGYAVGMGNVPWQQSELFPLSVRSLGSAMATATNWGSNTIIGITFLPMMEFFSPVGTFALYAVICMVAWWAIWRIYPETAGLELEEVGGLLKDDWGVQESVQRFKLRQRR